MNEAAGGIPNFMIGSFLRTVKMVLWGFLGIRKSSEWQKDAQKTNFFHIIVVGFGAAVLLIIGLMVLVRWVVST